MQGINTIFYVVVLIMSVVVHEVAHGIAADSQGDPTARYAGRLSLNPIRHLDLVGSVLLPLFLIITHAGFIIGWAKPVPYNERNLRNKRWGTAFVAAAGIFANIGLALIFGLSIRLAHFLGEFGPAYIAIASAIAIVNLVLAFFNLIPIPPLDGAKILFTFLPPRFSKFQRTVEYLSLPLLILFLYFLWPHVSPAIDYLFIHLAGAGSFL